jgi:hypothetical protein
MSLRYHPERSYREQVYRDIVPNVLIGKQSTPKRAELICRRLFRRKTVFPTTFFAILAGL